MNTDWEFAVEAVLRVEGRNRIELRAKDCGDDVSPLGDVGRNATRRAHAYYRTTAVCRKTSALQVIRREERRWPAEEGGDEVPCLQGSSKGMDGTCHVRVSPPSFACDMLR